MLVFICVAAAAGSGWPALAVCVVYECCSLSATDDDDYDSHDDNMAAQ